MLLLSLLVSMLNIVVVLAIYVKGPGAGGKHGSVPEIQKVVQASYISVQLFEHRTAEHFRAIPEATALLGSLQFAHLPSRAFLYALSPPPTVHGDGALSLSTDSDACSLFKDLKMALPALNYAMKIFAQRRKRKIEPQSDTDEAGED